MHKELTKLKINTCQLKNSIKIANYDLSIKRNN